MRELLLLAGMCLAFYTVCGQNPSFSAGARSQGLGATTACLADAWAIFNNPSGLTETRDLTAAFTQSIQPQLSAFNTTAAVIAMPVKTGTAAFGVSRTGDAVYREQALTTGYANTFGLASLGARLNLVQYHAEGFGTAHLLTLSLGGIARLTPAFSIGAYITNLNQPKFPASEERVPTLLTLGAAYKFSQYVWATTELQKDLDYAPTWKTGLEYEAHKKVIFRTGFNLHPNAAYFGAGFRSGNLGLDYAFAQSVGTGVRHHAAVHYTFKSTRK